MFSQNLMAQATEMINEFNSHVPEKHQYPVNELETRLFQLGASTDDDLADMTWEEWQEGVYLPKRLAKKVAAIFREDKQENSMTLRGDVIRTLSLKDEVGELGNRELVLRFAENPTAAHSAIADQLRARSGNKPCIAFEDDGKTMNVDATTQVLDGMQAGDEYGDVIKLEGRRVHLYKVGQRVGTVRDEHPLYPGVALRSDGLDSDEIDWSGVPLECRQLLRLAVECGFDPSAKSRQKLISLRDIASQDGAFDSLQERFPRAADLYEERRTVDNLPALKTRSAAKKPVMSAAYADEE